MTEEAVQDKGVVNITVDKDGVKYDTNMAIQDTVFWLEAVKQMVLQDTILKEEGNG